MFVLDSKTDPRNFLSKYDRLYYMSDLELDESKYLEALEDIAGSLTRSMRRIEQHGYKKTGSDLKDDVVYPEVQLLYKREN